jgi:hypothetical protein
MKSVEERFWSKVDLSGECWLWKASCWPDGYGQFKISHTVNRRAHRVAWELFNGPIPIGLSVLHHCDNILCVNPVHLFLGTQADNVHDCQTKGRLPIGEKAVHKLTLVQAREIKNSLLGNRPLARIYPVSRTAIKYIKTGRNWREALNVTDS